MLTSVEVAQMVGKNHYDLLKDIRKYCVQLAEGKIPLGEFFSESKYPDSNNQNRPCYLVTKKDCEFIAYKLTGQKGIEFTARYVNRFHEMEKDCIHPEQLNQLLCNSALRCLEISKEYLL